MKRIIVIRHAHKDGDELTPKGVEHANIVSENIDTIHVAVTSERNRTMHTAKILSGIEIRVDARANPPAWGKGMIEHIRTTQKTHRLGAVAAIWEYEENVRLAKEAGQRAKELALEMFSELGDGELGLIVSHDGTIVSLEKILAGGDFSAMPDHTFAELTGFFINEDLSMELLNK